MEVQRAVKDVSLHCFLLCDRINSSHSNKQGAQILPHCIFFKRLYQLKYNQQKMLWKLTDVKVVALVLPTANCINRNGSSPSKDLEYVRSLQWFAVKHIFKYFFLLEPMPTTGTIMWIRLAKTIEDLQINLLSCPHGSTTNS